MSFYRFWTKHKLDVLPCHIFIQISSEGLKLPNIVPTHPKLAYITVDSYTCFKILLMPRLDLTLKAQKCNSQQSAKERANYHILD